MPDPSSCRSNADAVPGSDLMSFTIGLMEIGARGLRTAVGRPIPAEKLYDVALGAALVSSEMAARALDSARKVKNNSTFRTLQLPTIPLAWRLMRIVEEFEQRGQRARCDDSKTVEQVMDVLVPLICEQLVRRIDLDSVIDTVDIDRAAGRLDIDAILDRVDLNAIVRDRVDVEAIVRTVDIDAVAARLDLDAVIERLDLPQLAQHVIDEIDLPGIIRESSGSMASEAVSGMRLHGIDADQAVHRAFARVLGHRRGAVTGAASAPLRAADTEVAAAAPHAPVEPNGQSTRPIP